MSTEEKEVRYRASKLVEQRGISYDEALVVATQELAEQVTTLKQARRNVFAEKGKRVQQEFKKLKNKKKSTVYTVNGSVVGNVVSGGAPGLGKKV